VRANFYDNHERDDEQVEPAIGHELANVDEVPWGHSCHKGRISFARLTIRTETRAGLSNRYARRGASWSKHAAGLRPEAGQVGGDRGCDGRERAAIWP